MIRQPEQPYPTILAAKRLHAIEDRLAVMQHAARRIQGERAVWHNARVVPATALVVLHHKHVVGEDGAEGKRLVRRGLLGSGGLGDGDLGQGDLLDMG